MPCLSERQLLLLIEGALSPTRIGEARAHLDDCQSCAQLLDGLAQTTRARGRAAPSHTAIRQPMVVASPDDQDITEPGEQRSPAEKAVLGGRFRLVRLLGHGAMGMVYEARDELLGVHVAVKLLQPAVAERPIFLKMMHTEIRVGRRINHPNVCRIYDLGTDGPCHFISMELVTGETLAEVLKKGPLTPAAAHEVLDQICSALEVAHREGVIHRDLKPANIMISPPFRVIVMDFGVASDLRASKTLRQGPIGTPAYWPPEQARGEASTPASDLYSLGVMTHELLTGALPGRGGAEDVSGLSPEVRAVVRRCLDPLPSRRFASAGEFREALHLALSRPRARTGLRPLALVAGAVGLVLAAATGWWLPSLQGEPVSAPPSLPSPPPTVLPAVEPSTPSVSRAAEASAPPANGPPSTAPEAVAVARPAVRPPVGPRQRVASPRPHLDGPPSAALPPSPVPVAIPQEAAPRAPEPAPIAEVNALAGVRVRLGAMEAQRVQRHLLLQDAPGYGEALSAARQAIEQAAPERAQAELERALALLNGVKIDRDFVDRKARRLNAAAASRHDDPATSARATEASQKATRAFFEGDYERANELLTAVEALRAGAP